MAITRFARCRFGISSRKTDHVDVWAGTTGGTTTLSRPTLKARRKKPKVSGQHSAVDNRQSHIGSKTLTSTARAPCMDLSLPFVQYQESMQGGLRAALLTEVTRRTQAGGVQFAAYPATFANRRADVASRPVSKPDAIGLQQQIESRAGIKIAISKAGWYRITQPELVAAGLDPNVNAPQLQLYANGRSVPIKQSGDEKHLTSSDYIEFYGRGMRLAHRRDPNLLSGY